MTYGLNAFFSLSFLPIRLLTYLGMALLFFISIVGLVFILAHTTDLPYLLFEQIRSAPDWTSIILAIFFVLGIQIIFQGILGEYIARIFDEVRSRPYYIVDQIYKAYNAEENESAMDE